jgi:hypothetical protein
VPQLNSNALEQAWTAAESPRAKRPWFVARLILGVVLLVTGILVSRRAFNEWGHDFAPQYMSACLLREGKNVYDFKVQEDGYLRHIGYVTTWAHFHPPGAAVVALPATLIPYQAARQLWFVVALAVMVFGLWRFMVVFLPRWDLSWRVLVLGMLMCAATTRWGFKVAQPGSIVLGGFGLFLAELRSSRSWVAFLCGGIIAAMKVTFGLPFFLMALAQRRWKLTVAMSAFVVVVNLVGLFGMGGPKILADYKANFAQFERADQLNYPDPRGSNSLARTDWPYLLNAFNPVLERNNRIGFALTLLALAWLTTEVLRARRRALEESAMLALSGPLAALSMLAVYHHHYDMGILLLPLLAFVGRPEFRALPLTWCYVLPVGLYAGLYPYDKFSKLAERFFGPGSVVVTRPLAAVVSITAFVTSLLLVRAVTRGKATQRAAGSLRIASAQSP